MEPREALAQISEIRQRMAHAEVFSGFRAAPTAFSGVLAVAGGVLQAVWLPQPVAAIGGYLALWIGAASLSMVAVGIALTVRYRRSASPLGRQTTWLVIEHLTPSIVAGGLVTLALARFAPQSVWLLPGLWQLFYCLGLFAACRHLPRGTLGVALFYLCSGALCLALARAEYALSPWAMAVPFGVGQLLTAGLLYWTLERTNDQEEE